ncbi:metallophosphoesterase family protein [Skermanella stibiiresistens]|uniref:metallophosphoesterase family protein n=1 Tax=Skermanella stibiiresistens TaxID=913326 RepID=UPI0004AD408C|nr:metallophosphoesterase [Skermanella stibiiresistens]
MTILFCGDPHGSYSQIIRAVAAKRPAAVVIVGDHDLEQPLDEVLAPVLDAGVRVWWIPGNHDGDRVHWYCNLFDSGLGDANLHGRVAEVAPGLRIAGLGGVFRGRIWHPSEGDGAPRFPDRESYLDALPPGHRWRGGLPLAQRVSIWWEDYQKLRAERADVLVCHEAPSSHRHGFGVLDDLARSMGARLIVHGHHHIGYQAMLPAGLRVIGIGRAGLWRLAVPPVLAPGREVVAPDRVAPN